MPWTRPEYDRPTVNAAAQRVLDQRGDIAEALRIVNNWRSSHSFPLNTFQLGLRRRAPGALIAQRLKRLDSLFGKLRQRPTMKLSQMQDVGGCRAVLPDVEAVRKLRQRFLESRMKHTDRREDDYLTTPRESGYRAIHLIYRYNSTRTEYWNGLKVEVQLRSRLQHAWAMAVETISTMVNEPLKASGGGGAEWREFLRLTSSAFALKEGTEPVAGTPHDPRELHQRIREMERALQVEPRLSGYKTALKHSESPDFAGSAYFLLELDLQARRLYTRGYSQKQLKQAGEEYLAAERRLEGKGSAVLVAVDRVEQLRKAFPSYYQDTDLFLQHLREICT